MAVTVTPEALAQSFIKYRPQLLQVILSTLGKTLDHMTVRPGIRYKEVVGELSGTMEVGPYSRTRVADEDIAIVGRELETYLGSVVKPFELNSLVQTIYGSNFTKGKEMATADVCRQVAAFLVAKIGKSLEKNLFSAVRNASGTTTAALFNGFDTIASTEITAGKITTTIGNLYEYSAAITSSNAVDTLKAIYRNAADDLQDIETKMFIPVAVYNAYVDDYQATVGAVPYNVSFEKTFLEGSRNLCELVPLSAKKDSDYIQLTTKGNMLVGCNMMDDSEKLLIAESKTSHFVLDFIATLFWGCQYESISPERLLIAKVAG